MNARIASWHRDRLPKETKAALRSLLASQPDTEFAIIGLDHNGQHRNGAVFTFAEAAGIYVEVRKSNDDLMAVVKYDATKRKIEVM
jgi:hypothetical protein